MSMRPCLAKQASTSRLDRLGGGGIHRNDITNSALLFDDLLRLGCRGERAVAAKDNSTLSGKKNRACCFDSPALSPGSVRVR